MGDTVNLASRLEGMNKEFGTAILASGATVGAAAGRVRFRGLGFAQAKGRAAKVEVHEVIGPVEPPEAGDAKPVGDCSGKQAK
jgi:adenylate cyclase